MKCKFCSSEIHHPTFDLGNAPPSNSLLSDDQLKKPEATFPLVLYVCPSCFLVQIDDQVSSHEIFTDSYVYFSSASKYWLQHAKRYSDKIIDRLSLSKSSFVIEVASNDGYLLKNFVDKGIKCLGIEPTRSTANEAMLKGIPTLVEFLDIELSEELSREGRSSDLVVANNVLAHVPNINNFVSALEKLLKPEGTITIEFPHLLKLIQYNEFDTIYHEHYFYFSLYTLSTVFDKHKLSIYDVDELDTHGGSLRVYLAKKGSNLDRTYDKRNVDRVIELEMEGGITSLDVYEKIRDNALGIKLSALDYIVNMKMDGKKIIAFGAAAKGNTFLNYLGVKNDLIDFVVDETPYKVHKFMPQSKIPILPFDEILNHKPDIIIILPWNHKQEIVEKLMFTKDWGAKLVTFIPSLCEI